MTTTTKATLAATAHRRGQGANLTDANLTGANLTGAILTDAKLSRANLTWGIKRVDADGTTGSRRTDARVITWPIEAGGWVEHPDATPGELCGVGLHLAKTWRGASLGGRLTDALGLIVGWHPGDVLSEDADKVRVSRCYVLPGAHSWVETARRWGHGAKLSGAILSGANLTGADLTGADLAGAKLSGAKLYGANLSRANLYDAILSGAKLSGAKLYGANLTGANLTDANLSGAGLSGANLYGTYLTDAILSRADLTDTILSDADLTDASLYGANLTRATASAYTLWPANIDPIARGVIVR